MISRVADNCFWLGRYLERMESTARVLRVTSMFGREAEVAKSQSWLPVVIVSGEQKAFETRFGDHAAADGEVVQQYLTFDRDNSNSIRASVAAARWNARCIREVISLEVWEALNELHLWFERGGAEELYEFDREGFYRRVRRDAHLCLGFVDATMLHDEPLDFLDLGVFLERVSQTARMLDVHYHVSVLESTDTVVQTAIWLSVLRACSGLEPFMKRSQGRVTPEAIARFLVFEPDFPRSIAFSIHHAFDRFVHMRPTSSSWPGIQSYKTLRRLREWLEGHRETHTFEPVATHQLLTHCVDETAALCVDIGRELLGAE